jgi:hypothetical protein
MRSGVGGISHERRGRRREGILSEQDNILTRPTFFWNRMGMVYWVGMAATLLDVYALGGAACVQLAL